MPVFEDLATRATYGGNPEHKKNPGDFKLSPPTRPRPDKSLCDGVSIFKRADAEALLKAGIRRGLVSEQYRGNWPQNVWSVTEGGVPVEGQLENEEIGSYHGYPMQTDDPLWDAVIERWREHEP